MKIGQELISGHWFDPIINWKFGPGYPLFLAMSSGWTDYNVYWVTFLQSGLFCLGLYFLVKSLFSVKVSKLVFIIICLVPEFMLTNGTIMSESISSSLFMIIFYLIFFSSYKRRFLLVSFLSGVLILCRFEFMLFLALFFLLSVYYKKIYNIKSIIIWSSFPILFLCLNTYKNFKTFNKITPSSYGAGTVLYGGNNLNLDGSWHPHKFHKEYIPLKYQEEYMSYSERNYKVKSIVKLDSLYKEMALDAWNTSVSEQLKLIPVKFFRILLLPANLDIYTMSIENNFGIRFFDYFTLPEFSLAGKLKHASLIIPHLVLIILIAFGFYKGYYINKEMFVCSISFFIVGSLFYSVVCYGLPRFNAPLLPFLSLSIGFVFRKPLG